MRGVCGIRGSPMFNRFECLDFHYKSVLYYAKGQMDSFHSHSFQSCA